MKLDKFHVRDGAARSPSHRDTVAGRDVRIARVEINLTRTAGRQHATFGAYCPDEVPVEIQDIDPDTPIGCDPEFRESNEIHCHMSLEDRNTGMGANPFNQSGLDYPAGCVRGMHDPAATMAAFTRQMEIHATVWRLLSGERDPLLDQPFDPLSTSLHNELGDIDPAQACSRIEGIGYMRLDRISLVDDRRDTALRVERRALLQRRFGDDSNVDMIGQRQCQAQTRRTAADDQHIEV